MNRADELLALLRPYATEEIERVLRVRAYLNGKQLAATPSQPTDGPSQEGADGPFQEPIRFTPWARGIFDGSECGDYEAVMEEDDEGEWVRYVAPAPPQQTSNGAGGVTDVPLVGADTGTAPPIQQTAQPVAWMYTHDRQVYDDHDPPLITVNRWQTCEEPWTETPLYAAHAVQPPFAEDSADRLALVKRLRDAADALEYANGYIEGQQETIAAYAAVQPIPREPTEEMIEAGRHAPWEQGEPRSAIVELTWRAMHDAFTNEQPKSTEP